jgi:hypothetical protein
MRVADDYEDLRHLVDRLTPAQARHLRVLVSNDEQLASATVRPTPASNAVAPLPSSFMELAGSIEGPGDVAERHDDYIRDRLRNRFSRHT